MISSSYKLEGVAEIPALKVKALSHVLVDGSGGISYAAVQFEKKFEEWGLLQVLLKYNSTGSNCSILAGDGYVCLKRMIY